MGTKNMKKQSKIISSLPIIAIVLVFLMPIIFATAMTTNQVAVSTDALSEDGADVWGRYITWRRFVDFNGDGSLGWTEPSWIMVQDITTGEEWNITPTIDAGYRQTTYYYYVSPPRIYQDHIIYIDYVGGSVNTQTIKMYNITQDTTWEVSYYNHLDIRYTVMGFIDIYDDWIAIGNATGTNNDLYLYNYEQDIAKTVSAWQETNIDVTGLSISNSFVTYTERNTVTNVYTLGIFNIEDSKNAVIEFPISVSSVNANSDSYEDNVVFSYYISGTWDTFLLNTEAINWSISGWTGTPPSKSFNWIDLLDNVTVIYDGVFDAHNPHIWDNYIAYNTIIGGSDDNIIIYDISRNSSYNLTDSPYKQRLSSIYDNKVLWNTNENSLVAGVGADANFDIYRTQTDLEQLGQDVMNMTPMIITVLFFGFILGAFVLFGRSGGDGF